jgi:hypothetical protein
MYGYFPRATGIVKLHSLGILPRVFLKHGHADATAARPRLSTRDRVDHPVIEVPVEEAIPCSELLEISQLPLRLTIEKATRGWNNPQTLSSFMKSELSI